MKHLKVYGLSILMSGLFLTACNNNQQESTDEVTPPPVEKDAVSRYNINEPDKSVLKLDSTTVDSTQIDTIRK